MEARAIIQRLKEIFEQKDLESMSFKFDCGGDHINEFYFESALTNQSKVIKNKHKIISDEEEDMIIEDIILNLMSFYEDSNGTYLGEHGIVTLKLKNDVIEIKKESSSTHNEEFLEEEKITNLTDSEKELLKHVKSIQISAFDAETVFEYHSDILLTKEKLDVEKSISEKVQSGVDKLSVSIPHFFDSISSIHTSIESDCIRVIFHGYKESIIDEKPVEVKYKIKPEFL